MDDEEIDYKKQLFLDSATDAVHDLMYQNRKDDSELDIDDVDELLKSKHITKAEIMEVFSEKLDEWFDGESDE